MQLERAVPTNIARMDSSSGQTWLPERVFVPGLMDLGILHQPRGAYGFISDRAGVVTLFQSALHYGVTGLLAHNYLSGELFYHLEPGQLVQVSRAGSLPVTYQVTLTARFQKKYPDSLTSDLVALENGETFTCTQAFDRFYTGPHHLTFQTCLAIDGVQHAGLLFVLASPLRVGCDQPEVKPEGQTRSTARRLLQLW